MKLTFDHLDLMPTYLNLIIIFEIILSVIKFFVK